MLGHRALVCYKEYLLLIIFNELYDIFKKQNELYVIKSICYYSWKSEMCIVGA